MIMRLKIQHLVHQTRAPGGNNFVLTRGAADKQKEKKSSPASGGTGRYPAPDPTGKNKGPYITLTASEFSLGVLQP